MKTSVLSASVVACVWLTAAPAVAHHAFSAEFGAKRPVHFQGTVAKVE